MRTLSIVVLALQFAALPLAAQAQLANTTAYTTAAVSLRAKPDSNARSLGRLGAETPVQVVACENGWCQTAVNGLNGYLPRLSLTAEPNGSFKEDPVIRA
jgi:SH3-like domain-containing protein